jgi:hypothetical protein
MKSLIAILVLIATTSTALADDGYPNTIPHPPTAPPSEGPSTPVPPPPTDSQMYQYYVGQLTILYAQLRMAERDLALYRTVLSWDPDRLDALSVVRSYEARVAMLQLQIAWIQYQISLLNP